MKYKTKQKICVRKKDLSLRTSKKTENDAYVYGKTGPSKSFGTCVEDEKSLDDMECTEHEKKI